MITTPFSAMFEKRARWIVINRMTDQMIRRRAELIAFINRNADPHDTWSLS